jgi:hypothetical protein
MNLLRFEESYPHLHAASQRQIPPPPSPAFWARSAAEFRESFKYKKEKRLNSLIYLDRDGQFLAENGQFVVFNGQKTVAKLAE